MFFTTGMTMKCSWFMSGGNVYGYDYDWCFDGMFLVDLGMFSGYLLAISGVTIVWAPSFIVHLRNTFYVLALVLLL